ncbi:uncharacterized protein LOC122575497 [Bombus pyrosoma]|uniref:uncharacterized protein LOC122575497 n=1 Tax=Bombus pyrosoma TaxID=396416 RepID=UPI001CB954A7|nr:uncharacterized protein LOC122575497 [Bombus pyrosoma]
MTSDVKRTDERGREAFVCKQRKEEMDKGPKRNEEGSGNEILTLCGHTETEIWVPCWLDLIFNGRISIKRFCANTNSTALLSGPVNFEFDSDSSQLIQFFSHYKILLVTKCNLERRTINKPLKSTGNSHAVSDCLTDNCAYQRVQRCIECTRTNVVYIFLT